MIAMLLTLGITVFIFCLVVYHLDMFPYSKLEDKEQVGGENTNGNNI